MIYIGIDLSLNRTAITILSIEGELVFNKVLNIGKLKLRGERRLDYIYRFFDNLFKGKSLVVGLEGYSFGSRGRATFSIGEAGGILRLLLYRWKMSGNIKEFYIFAPNTIKKYACGGGHAKKSQMLKACLQTWDFDTNDEDIADAYAIAKLTHDYHKFINNRINKAALKSYQKKMLEKIKKDKGVKDEEIKKRRSRT